MEILAEEVVSKDIETRISVHLCVCPVGHLHKTGGTVVSLFLQGLLRIIGGISDSSAGIDGSSVFLVSRELINVNSFARGFDRSRKKKLSLPEVPTSAQAGKWFSVLLEMVKLRAPPVVLLCCGEHNKHDTDLFLFRKCFIYHSFFKGNVDQIYCSTLRGNRCIMLLIASHRNFSYPDLMKGELKERRNNKTPPLLKVLCLFKCL